MLLRRRQSVRRGDQVVCGAEQLWLCVQRVWRVQDIPAHGQSQNIRRRELSSLQRGLRQEIHPLLCVVSRRLLTLGGKNMHPF